MAPVIYLFIYEPAQAPGRARPSCKVPALAFIYLFAQERRTAQPCWAEHRLQLAHLFIYLSLSCPGVDVLSSATSLPSPFIYLFERACAWPCDRPATRRPYLADLFIYLSEHVGDGVDTAVPSMRHSPFIYFI